MQFIQNKRLSFFIGIFALFHFTGFVGLLSPYQSFFASLSGFNLLFTAYILFSYQKEGQDRAFWLALLLIAVTGFLAEIIGIHTGYIFGDYQYGNALGIKLWDVPLIIGVNWAMLLFACIQIAFRFVKKRLIIAIIAALLMVLIDLLIEPIAIQIDYWTWNSAVIPLSNYLGWLGVSFVLAFVCCPYLTKSENKLAPYLYVVQFIFFLMLNFLL